MPDDGEGGGGHRSLADRLLDLIVFAPAGALLSAAEDWPAMADKGRERVDRELRNAHLVGRFAVDVGRRQIQSHLDTLLAGAQAPRADRPAGGRARRPAAHQRPGPESPEGPAGGAGGAEVASDEATGTVTEAVPADPLVDRAIPGYDALSASQVVRRLDGLGPEELAAVERHEFAGRGRRTIVTRARQLLDEHSGPDAAD